MTDYYKEAKDILGKMTDQDLINELGTEKIKLTDEYILRCFDDKDYEYFKNSVGIITNSRDKAISILDNLYMGKKEAIYRRSRFDLALYYEGKDYRWVKPNDNSRGHKFGEAYIDADISEEKFHDIVQPMCSYVPKNKVHII